MSDLEQDISRAEQAAMLLSHPLFVEAFDSLDKRFDDAWISSPARDVEGREVLWLSRKLLAQLRQHLATIIETGQLADADIEMSRRGQS